MKSIGRLTQCHGDTLRLDREHDIRKGDVLAASYMDVEDPPLRTGRVVVAAVERDGRVLVTTADAIPALVADREYGDWLYRIGRGAAA